MGVWDEHATVVAKAVISGTASKFIRESEKRLGLSAFLDSIKYRMNDNLKRLDFVAALMSVKHTCNELCMTVPISSDQNLSECF